MSTLTQPKDEKRTTTKWITSGIVEAPLEAVWNVFIENAPYLSAHKGEIFSHLRDDTPYITTIAKPNEGRITFSVDPMRHEITIQGEWWYRGVWHFEEQPNGCRITYQIFNIAPGVGWWAAQLVQGPEAARNMEAQHQASLQAIRDKLNPSLF